VTVHRDGWAPMASVNFLIFQEEVSPDTERTHYQGRCCGVFARFARSTPPGFRSTYR